LAIYEDFTKTEDQEWRNQITVSIESSIMDNIEKKQLVWYEFVQGMDRNRLLKQEMEYLQENERGEDREQDGRWS